MIRFIFGKRVVKDLYELNAEVDKYCSYIMDCVDDRVRGFDNVERIEYFRTELMKMMYADYLPLLDEFEAAEKVGRHLTKEKVRKTIIRRYSEFLALTEKFLSENKISEVI